MPEYLSPSAFKEKWNLKFADNKIQDITEPVLREFKDDIALLDPNRVEGTLAGKFTIRMNSNLAASGDQYTILEFVGVNGGDAGALRWVANATNPADAGVFEQCANYTGEPTDVWTSMAGKPLQLLVLPMNVRAGSWYVTASGIWEAKQTFNAQALPASNAFWKPIAGFNGQLPADAQTINAAAITDATDAGRAMLKAADAAAQLQLVDKLSIEAGLYGPHPAFSKAYGEGGLLEYLLKSASARLVKAPAAPTEGRVDDIGNTFWLKPNPLYPNYTQYKVGGLPGVAGPVYLDATNAYPQGDFIIVKVVGAVPKGGLTVYVAGSGNVPDGTPLANLEPFTGDVIAPPAGGAAPTLTSFSPASAAVGASVTLTGTNLTGATGVLFNGTAANFTVLNATTINTTVPVGATNGRLSVATPAGTAQSPTDFVVGAGTPTGPTTTTPDAPFEGFDPVSRTLTFSHALGTSELEISRLGGSFSPYAPVQVDDLAHNAGEWKARVKAFIAGNRNPSGTTDSRAIGPKVVANVIPVADAGTYSAITLPTNSLALMGTGTDADGTVTEHSWRLIQGPNAPAGLPATTANVVVSNLVAGVYQFGYRVRDNQGAWSEEKFVLLTVNPAVATAPSFVVSTPQFSQNNSDSPRSEFATWSAYGNPSSISLTFTSSLFNSFPEAAELAVYDGTTFAGVVSATGSGEQTKTLALPGTGFRVITVVEGAQSVLNDLGGEQQGTFLVRVDFPMGSSATLVTPVRTANSLGFTADSNSNGFGSDVNPRDAYAVLLRPMLGYDVTLGGYGYKSWSRSLDTDAKQNAHVSTVVATHAGRALKQEVYNLGTNDAYLNMGTPAQVQAIATSTWSKLRAADPTVLIYCLTPFRCPSIENTPNQLGFTMAQYRAALAVAAEAVGGVQLWDGLEAVPEAQLASDGVHLTNAGHQSAANYVYAKLLAVAVPLILGDTYLKVGGSEAWRYAEFTTCLTFRKSATTGNYAILSCQTIDAPAGQSQGTYGIYTYDGTLRAGIYVNGTANEISLPMPAGDLLVTVLFKASPTARELRVNDAIVTAGGVPIPVNQFPLTIGAVRTGVGDATTVTGLKSPVTNFSFFSVYQTAAESSALMAAKGQITPAQLASPTCFSYGRLIRQNSGSTSLLDAKTGTASILILKPDGSAATAPVVPQVVFDTDLTRWSYGAGWVDSRANGGISNSPDYPAGAHHYLIPDPGNGPATISFNGSKFDYETAQASVYNFATRLIIDGTTIQDVGPGFTAVTGLGSGNHTLQVVNVPDSGRLASVCKFVFYPNS